MSRKATVCVPKPLRLQIAAMLGDLIEQEGHLPTDRVADLAHQLCVSERTIRRWAAGHIGDRARRDKYTLSEGHLAVLASAATVKAAWQTLRASDEHVPGYVQFTRAVNACDPALIAGARFGRHAMHSKQVYLAQEPTLRNEAWWIDHYYVPVRVTWNKSTRPVAPVQTTIIDDATRTIVAAVLWPKAPTAADVRAVIAKAVFGRMYGDTFVGGVPDALRSDRGAELIGFDVTETLLRLGTLNDPARPRGAWEKGKIERFQRTLDDELYSTVHGWTGGPTNYAGDSALAAARSDLIDLPELKARLDGWVVRYNTSRPHSSLDGRTPLEVWAADQTTLRRGDEQAIASVATRVTRQVRKEGVRVHDTAWLHPALNGHVGRSIDAAYLPDQPDFVWVYVDGCWMRAVPHADLAEAQVHELLSARTSQERKVTAAHRTAREARRNISATHTATAGDELPFTPTVPVDDDGLDVLRDVVRLRPRAATAAEQAQS